MFSDTELRNAVSIYKKQRATYQDSHIIFIKGQNRFEDVISNAARAINAANKIHSHQRRIGRKKLEEFASKIISIEPELKKAKTFDILYNLIKSLKITGIGLLTTYDTALRIACTKTECLPDKIYLHTGTREGVKQITPQYANKLYILKKHLPVALSESDLNCSELEDFLCHIVSKRYSDNPFSDNSLEC